MTINPFAETRYEKITSRSCKKRGMRAIVSKEECTAAAIYLHLQCTAAYPKPVVCKDPIESKEKKRPHGCYFRKSNHLTWLMLDTNPANIDRGFVGPGWGPDNYPICAPMPKG